MLPDRRAVRLFCSLAAVMGLACQRGDGNGSPPLAPRLTVAVGLKQLHFQWTPAERAEHYRLYEDPDGSGFVWRGGELLGTALDLAVPVHLLDWSRSRYRVGACNPDGCTPSDPVAVADKMIGAIGYFKASNTGVGDGFGASMSLSADGTTLAVGAPGEASVARGVDGDESDDSAPNAGAVYVFVRAGDSWSQEAYLKASNTAPSDMFGVSVALSADGSTLAVGAYQEQSAATGINGSESDNSADQAGAVYVFTRTAGSWAQQAFVKASNTRRGQIFGCAVALSADGDTLAVGALGERSKATGIDGDQSDTSLLNAGAVYVFSRTGASWGQQAYVKASNTGTIDRFGTSVALSADGDTLAVGAPNEASAARGIDGNQADNSAPFAGALYVFSRADGAWAQEAYVKASNAEAEDMFGQAVALSADGNTLAAGAYYEDGAATGVDGNASDNSAQYAGAAYVFGRAAGVWAQQAYIKASNTGASDLFGRALALSGGGDLLAVGAEQESSAAVGVGGSQADDSATWSGAAYVFARAAGTWSQRAYVKAPTPGTPDLFGSCLSFSSDGGTLAVAAPLERSAATGVGGAQSDDSMTGGAGAVYLF